MTEGVDAALKAMAFLSSFLLELILAFLVQTFIQIALGGISGWPWESTQLKQYESRSSPWATDSLVWIILRIKKKDPWWTEVQKPVKAFVQDVLMLTSVIKTERDFSVS